MCNVMKGSAVDVETLSCYEGGTELEDVKIIYHIFWSFYHTSEHSDIVNQWYKSMGHNSMENTRAFCWLPLHRTETKISFLLHLCSSNERPQAAIHRSNGAWNSSRAYHMFYIRHIASNFLRRFKAPHLHHLVVSMGYSRTEAEYNTNRQKLKDRGEAYTQWTDHIGRSQWVLAFDT
ncbi:hypothetical protein PIB30_098252 [Stylosanthes scabra]|uniref:Uncharacterized protein n=1 Tax=Stylosanthes scabra TaxID=79078 RepID=A0ABU6QXA3_9FABA|nr:hypothetical protein [Stylosanthes scabra]